MVKETIMVAEIIDELNKRREESLDNDDNDTYEVLTGFYEWFIEKYVI